MHIIELGIAAIFTKMQLITSAAMTIELLPSVELLAVRAFAPLYGIKYKLAITFIEYRFLFVVVGRESHCQVHTMLIRKLVVVWVVQVTNGLQYVDIFLID